MVTQLLDVPSSEQQLVGCVTVDSGCNDELTNNGFAFQQEECHAYRDKLQLHCNTGHWRDFEIAQESATGCKGVSTDRDYRNRLRA